MPHTTERTGVTRADGLEALDDPSSWPALPYEPWIGTRTTLHRFVQVVGKVRMSLAPPRNHWWHVPLYVHVRGLTTGPMPDAGRLVEIRFDLLDHELVVTSSDGAEHRLDLQRRSVASFHDDLLDVLHRIECRPDIRPEPFDLPDDTAFTQDTEQRPWDADAVGRFWAVLRNLHPVFEEFAGWSVAKTSPVHLFWHSLDLAVTRFSGQRAPPMPDADPVTRQAYSHEVISFGFWAGNPDVPFPALYSYTAPEPDGLTEQPLAPAAARWEVEESGAMALLDYETVRTSQAPRQTVLEFLESAYLAGARAAGWDIDALASPHHPQVDR